MIKDETSDSWEPFNEDQNDDQNESSAAADDTTDNEDDSSGDDDDDDDEDISDVDEKPPPIKKRKKEKRNVRDYIQPEWITEQIFTCHDCGNTCQGFQASLEHMTDQHCSLENEESIKTYKCIQCSRGFSRKDHLKRHIYSHILESNNPPNEEEEEEEEEDMTSDDLNLNFQDNLQTTEKGSKFRAKLIKENQTILDKITEDQWEAKITELNCYECKDKFTGVSLAFDHMAQFHPVVPNPDDIKDEPNADDQDQTRVKCIGKIVF
jgi:hypothetical protein